MPTLSAQVRVFVIEPPELAIALPVTVDLRASVPVVRPLLLVCVPDTECASLSGDSLRPSITLYAPI